MASYKTTAIIILFISLANSACPRPQANYCADVDDHNCKDRPPPDASMSDATASPTDASPDTNTVHMCAKNADCPSDVCSPEGMCVQEDNVAYVSQFGTNIDNDNCTRDAPCGSLQGGLQAKPTNISPPSKPFPYVRVSGSLITRTPITITQSVTILGDTDTELIYNAANHVNPVLTIQTDTSITPITPITVIINNFKITETSGTDSIRISAKNPTVKLTHVLIDDGDAVGMANGHGIITSDSSAVAMNPNIILTDVIIRGKDNGIQMTDGKLTVTHSSIVSNTGYGIVITGKKEPTNNTFEINQSSSISNNKKGGIFCNSDSSDHMPQVSISSDVDIWGNGDASGSGGTPPQVIGCNRITN